MKNKSLSCPHCGQPLQVEATIKRGDLRHPAKKQRDETSFSSDNAISEFINDKKLYIKILGEFFKFRGDIFLSEEEFRYNVSSNIKSARLLASSKFEIQFYVDLIKFTQERLAEIQKTSIDNVFITNLATVTKFIQQFRKEYPGYNPNE
jgi:hypothetical protein